ncbi:spdB [Streptomyces sp. SPB78]|nr:spdB [Streptomyces sp. SPB78]
MVLTLAVVVMWLGASMPVPVAVVVGLGIDGGWLATLAYDRRLAAQGDHSTPVTLIGWAFGLIATAVLVIHALGEPSPGAWLAVAWLPVAAKALWLVHGMWERTALTPEALTEIQEIQQESRDRAAVARATLRAQAVSEETRMVAVTTAGARVARVQSDTARRLADAWGRLEATRQEDGTARALTCVTPAVTPGSRPRWELPVWGPVTPLASLGEAAPQLDPAMTDDEIDAVLRELREAGVETYREASPRFRALGHSASEKRLRASWRRVGGHAVLGEAA